LKKEREKANLSTRKTEGKIDEGLKLMEGKGPNGGIKEKKAFPQLELPGSRKEPKKGGLKARAPNFR